jgi:dipeptidyl aminopeptidase/acylaminoacyl peptidase
VYERNARAIGEAFSNVDPCVSPDGRLVVFRSTRDGVAEAYVAEVARPTGPARRITRNGERVAWAGFTQDGTSIVFLQDTHGDHRFQLYRAPLDGNRTVRVTTDATRQHHPPLLPAGMPSRLVYSARCLGTPTTCVVVHDAGTTPRDVYEDRSGGACVDIAATGTRALFLGERGTALIDIELETGVARRLVIDDATIACAAYAADGTAVVVAYEDDAAGAQLAVVDALTGSVTVRKEHRDPPGSYVSRLAVSPAGDRIAVRLDAGSFSQVRVLDAVTLTPVADVAAPRCGVELFAFERDGRRFAITVSQPERPVEMFSVEVATGSITAMRDEPRAILGGAGVDVSIHHVDADDGLAIPVNLYLPRDRHRRCPTLVLVHGGPAASAQVRWNPIARFFASLGFAIIEPNIRGSIGFGRDFARADRRERRWAAFRDIEAVHAWAARNAWCDARRMVLMGGSYGGYVTLMCASLRPAAWRAACTLFAITDLRKYVRLGDGALVEQLGDPEADAELLAALSPSKRLDQIATPLFVYAGENDPIVSRRDSQAVVRELQRRGVPVELMIGRGEGHSIERRDTLIEFLVRSARFFEEHLA